MKPKVSKSFTCVKTVESVYTGGQVEWFKDRVFTLAKGAVNIVKDGEVIGLLNEEEDLVINFTLAGNDTELTVVTAHKSGLVRIWDCTMVEQLKIVRSFRSIHSGSISVMQLHTLSGAHSGTVLATGGTEGTVKVWDLTNQYYTHNFRTSSTVSSCLTFHPHKLLLYGGFSSGALICWDLTTSKQVQSMEAHFSAVTAFSISTCGLKGVSCGRDAVCVMWDLSSHSKLSTVPVFSAVEGMVMMENMKVVLASGNKLSVWNLNTPAKVKELEVGGEITSLRSQEDTLHCTTSDHNMLTISKDDLVVKGCTVGNNDEVLDLVMMGEHSTHLAVACNSPLVRLYNRATWSCVLATGHTDTVLCLATCPTDPTILASGGKDNEVRVWRLVENRLSCLVVGSGHTECVGGLAWGGDSTQLVTVSKDTTLKVWKMTENSLSSIRTEIAHEKDINCVCVAPDGCLIATGSQDKLAKIWSQELGLVSVLRGHNRGVWCVQFSPVDRLVASGSADATIRLWSLADGGGSCVKILEGHDTSVLRLGWVGGGQIVSSSSGGLIKSWWVARQECTATVDMGENKIWALTTHMDSEGVLHITAGSGGGKIAEYKDTTEEGENEKQAEKDRIVVQHQKLNNLLQDKLWGKAIRLALKLSQPFTALKILKKLSQEEIEEAVLSLDNAGLDQLLGYTVKWNTNTKHCTAAQAVLYAILTHHDTDLLLSLPGVHTWVQGLLPYTEKHFHRLTKLQTKSQFLPYIIQQMKATSIPVDSLVDNI